MQSSTHLHNYDKPLPLKKKYIINPELEEKISNHVEKEKLLRFIIKSRVVKIQKFYLLRLFKRKMAI